MGISPNQAVRNAIEAEHAASRFYRLLAESTDDDETRSFLEEMAQQETHHARAIEEASKDVVSGPLPAHAVGQIEGIETLPDWRFFDGISLPQAFRVALAAEEQASMVYDAMADGMQGKAQEFFRELSRAEEEHGHRLRQRMEKLGLK